VVPGVGWGVALTATGVNIVSGFLRGGEESGALDELAHGTEHVGRNVVAGATDVSHALHGTAFEEAGHLGPGLGAVSKGMGYANVAIDFAEFFHGAKGLTDVQVLDKFFEYATPEQLDEFAKIMNERSRTWNEALFGPSRSTITAQAKALGDAKRKFEEAEREYEKALAAFLDSSSLGACLRSRGL
jgi:hypothetical protein